MTNEPKELAGNFRFGKMQVGIKEDAHGDKKAHVKIEIDPVDAPKWTALAAMPQVNFEADVFVHRNPTYGSGQERGSQTS